MSNKDKSGWKETPLVIRRRDAARLNRLAPGILKSKLMEVFTNEEEKKKGKEEDKKEKEEKAKKEKKKRKFSSLK